MWTCETCKVRGDCMASALKKRATDTDRLEGFYVGGEFSRARCETRPLRHNQPTPFRLSASRQAILNFILSAPEPVNTRQIEIESQMTNTAVEHALIALLQRGLIHKRRDTNCQRTCFYWSAPIPDNFLPSHQKQQDIMLQIADLRRAGNTKRSIARVLGVSFATVGLYCQRARALGILED